MGDFFFNGISVGRYTMTMVWYGSRFSRFVVMLPVPETNIVFAAKTPLNIGG